MLANILVFLLSVVSLTPDTKTSVHISDGSMPEGATAVYSNTDQKNRITAGNSATLTLSGWQEQQIESVVLSMKSNTKSGAGRLTMTVDGSSCWEIANASFDSPTWAGSYSTAYTDISHTFNPAVRVTNGVIEICIEATTNSLYIERYTISYSTVSIARTVSLINHVSEPTQYLTEERPGSGIILPSLQWESGDWHFAGWSEKDVLGSETVPDILQAGMRYFPKQDITLIAIFTNEKEIAPIQPMTELQDGIYELMTLTEPLHFLCTGVPNNSLMMLTPMQAEDINSYISSNYSYNIECTSDSTAYITHSSHTPIGHNGTQLAKTASEWVIRRTESDGWYIYYDHQGERIYWSFALQYDSNTQRDELRLALNKAPLAWQLLDVTEAMEKRLYSSEPLSYIKAVEQTDEDKHEAYTLQIGIWTFKIQNGHKQLIIP